MYLSEQLMDFFKQYAITDRSSYFGMPISFLPLKESPTAGFLLAFKDGVAYEREAQWGISHFIEHILFRGTKKYPTLYELSRKVEGMGGRISAYSTRDMTAFWVKTLPGYEEDALDVLGELVLNPLLEEEFIEKEKEIIYQERQRELNNPSFLNSLMIEGILLSPDPISRHPVGDDRIIAGFDSETLRSHLKEAYHRNSVAMGIAGSLSPKLEELLKDFTALLPCGAAPQRANHLSEDPGPGPVYLLPSHHKSQVYLSMGWKWEINSEKDIFIWRVINSLLGSGYTSLFNKVLRERENITYLCTTGLNTYENTGIFKLNLALDIKNLNRALFVIQEVLDQLAHREVPQDVFKEAVVKHASHLIYRLEDPLETAKILAHNLLRENRAFSFIDYLTNLDNVTFKEASDKAAECLSSDKAKIFIQTGAEGIENHFSKVTFFQRAQGGRVVLTGV